jgi:hypothetical protein
MFPPFLRAMVARALLRTFCELNLRAAPLLAIVKPS